MTIATRLNDKQRERIARNIVGYQGPMSGFNQFLESDQAKKSVYNNAITQIDQKMAVKMQSGGDVKATEDEIQKIFVDKLGRAAATGADRGLEFYKDYTKYSEDVSNNKISGLTVDRYFDLSVDQEIDPAIICPLIGKDKTKQFYTKKMFDCENLIEENPISNIYFDVDDTEDICE